jgi:hypothetical protein
MLKDLFFQFVADISSLYNTTVRNTLICDKIDQNEFTICIHGSTQYETVEVFVVAEEIQLLLSVR